MQISKLIEHHQTLLTDAGYDFQDLSDDELAKLHVRYMIGGMPPRLVQEQVYQFNFPEYPGALMNFLNLLGETYNITLFHYRNHRRRPRRL